jgi:hypothetical protein
VPQPILDTPRRGISEANGDFEWFKHMVYDHTTAMPEHCAAVGPGNPYCRAVRMGDYSRTRLAEDHLRQIYDWAVGLGLEIPIEGNVSDAQPAGTGATYNLNVTQGRRGRCGDDRAGDPSGVGSRHGDGRRGKGVRMDKQAKANVAE